MTNKLTERISERTGVAPSEVSSTIEALFFELHRAMFEYEEGHGDYIGEELHWHITPRAYFHFCGLLQLVAERSDREIPYSEKLLRLRQIADWQPFSDETTSWIRSSRFPQ